MRGSGAVVGPLAAEIAFLYHIEEWEPLVSHAHPQCDKGMPLDYLDPFGSGFWVRIGVSILCGGMIGLERQLRGKPAGIRTSILICMGTQFFVLLGSAIVVVEGDPTRVLGQVVTGIGFLGAGVILTREGLVVGVTSAATIWLLAAVGATIGLGFLPAAIAVSVTTVAILVGVEQLEKSFHALRRGVHELRSSFNFRNGE